MVDERFPRIQADVGLGNPLQRAPAQRRQLLGSLEHARVQQARTGLERDPGIEALWGRIGPPILPQETVREYPDPIRPLHGHQQRSVRPERWPEMEVSVAGPVLGQTADLRQHGARGLDLGELAAVEGVDADRARAERWKNPVAVGADEPALPVSRYPLRRGRQRVIGLAQRIADELPEADLRVAGARHESPQRPWSPPEERARQSHGLVRRPPQPGQSLTQRTA